MEDRIAAFEECNRAPLLAALLLLGWVTVTAFFWAFAFYHIPPATSEWLKRIQTVCFGTGESGLPDTAGWIMLILAPLSLLACMAIALGEEMRVGVQKAVNSTVGMVLVSILAFLITVEGIWIFGRISQALIVSEEINSSGDLPLGYARLDRSAPNFSLVDQHGKRVELKSFTGKNIVLTFAFAHCRTVCPAIIERSKAALKFPEASAALLFIITLDPWRDRPSSLPSMAAEWKLGSQEYFLSGDVNEVVKTLDAYQVPRERNETTGDVVHPALVYIIDPSGKIAFAFNNPTPAWIAEGIRRASLEPNGKP